MGLTLEDVRAPDYSIYIMAVYVVYQIGIELSLEVYQHFTATRGEFMVETK